MSYHDKMRELAGAIVEMSPEAPAYPGDTRPRARPVRKRPALMFAFVALTVLAIAAIPVWLFGGGQEPGPAATTVPAPATTLPATPTTVPTDPPGTTTPPVSAASTALVFLTTEPGESLTGNPALAPIRVLVPAEPANPAREVFYALGVLTHVDIEVPSGYDLDFPADVEVLSVTAAPDTPGTLIVDMNSEFLKGAGGLLADFTMLNQLIYTATYRNEFDTILFLAEGKPVEAFGAEGIDLTGAVSRDSYETELASIYLTEPAVLEGETIRIAGKANTFEANVVFQLLARDGTVLLEDFTTASCGSGCWGDFDIPVADVATKDAVWVRLLEYSAQDGSPQNVITVPIQRPDGSFALFEE